MELLQPDDPLSRVVGSKAIPRTEVTMKIWAYIKSMGFRIKEIREILTPTES